MIEVSEVRKAFSAPFRGKIVAVDGLSFRVKAGEVYGLLGPNGAGKTTTLRMMATLIRPDSGTITLNGVNVVSDPLAARATLAYVPAEAGLPPQLPPRDVVRLFAKIQGVSNATERADALLDRLGASSYAGTPCGELSTGMKRRVVLARALVHEPDVLLLDEPTDGLDVPGRHEVLALVRDEAAAGRAVIVSSHIMGEVERVVDRIGMVTRGTLVAEGTLPEVLDQAGVQTLDDAFLAFVQQAERT